jgi:hypothetical protein
MRKSVVHVARTGGTRKCIQILGNEKEGKKTLEIPTRKLELI